jgi:predicted phage-related endonuclease
MGISPWFTRWDAWAFFLGLLLPRPPDERQKMGLRLEPVIVRTLGEELGVPVTLNAESFRHPERRTQHATPDGFGETVPRFIIEAKNVALDQAGEWGESGTGAAGVPSYYAVQGYWQMSATELETCFIAAFIGGVEFRYYEIPRDREIEGILLEEWEQFRRDYVLTGTPPPMGASREAREYLARRWPRQRRPLRPAAGEEIAWLDEYAQLRLRQKTLQTRRDELENKLKEAIGEAEGLEWPQGKITWKKTRDRQEVNWQQLAESQLVGYAGDERAALLHEHTEVLGGTRRFLFRGEEEEG